MRMLWMSLVAFMLVLAQGCLTPKKIIRYRARQQQIDSLERIELKAVSVSQRNKIQVVPDKQIDILHCDLDVSFIWSKHECIGKATLKLKPYYYPTDSIILDAKAMVLSKIDIQDQNGQEIQFQLSYDKKKLKLQLERKITVEDTLTLSIAYVAHPDEVENQGGQAIKDEKGLYFINTDNAEPYKPIQLWTQGESDANSAWFPTIDHPNEKFTSTLTITANKDFTILSNGERVSTTILGNNRVEKWVNAKPMPAYLIMMAIGNFNIVDDNLGNLPVNYYLEKSYAPLAKQIFKHTPDMIDFFANKLDVAYPWNKYSQVVVRDYVSGAMENTSATLHGEFVQKNERELVDNDNDGIIAHELFHQWFGDLVTCKSWSHLVLNEGFATYGEQLWQEYKYGPEEALIHAYSDMQRYLNYTKDNPDNPIINFNYAKPDDMFNTITYKKGGRVLHLLRQEVGDEAFFLSLKKYLTKYQYGNADIDDLRKEFEGVTGKDLSPFFQQWFWKGGHPSITVRYDYIDSSKIVMVTVEQTPKENMDNFVFPLQFKIKDGSVSKDFTFTVAKRKEVFYVKKINEQVDGFPNIIIDPYSIFIGDIQDNKPFFYHIKTYQQGGNYVEKVRALKALSLIQKETDTARKVLISGLNDKLVDIRLKALGWIQWDYAPNVQDAYTTLVQLSKEDVNANVRAAATLILAGRKDPSLMNHFVSLTNDKSYTVAGNGLYGIYQLIPAEGLRLCPALEVDARGKLLEVISSIYSESKDSSKVAFYMDKIPQFFNRMRSTLINDYVKLIQGINQPELNAEAISFLERQAKHDQNDRVRFNCIVGMKNIGTSILNLANGTKEPEPKQALMEMHTLIQDKINTLLYLEEDEEVLNMLKAKGITRIE